MVLEEFLGLLKELDGRDGLTDFCRKHLLHGTPHAFRGNEDAFFEFRRRIARKFDVGFHEVFIVGSAKLGFNPRKKKTFDLESDVDVAIVSQTLFDSYMNLVLEYQIELRRSKRSISESDLRQYHNFLEYVSLGWIRPDKLPLSVTLGPLKDDWFSFFRSISHGKSEVGDYKAAAGVFKSYFHLEKYLIYGLTDVYEEMRIRN